MSLLETTHTKFKIPYIFVAGVLFVIALLFFANYLEEYPQSDTKGDVATEKDFFTIKIVNEETFFVEDAKVEFIALSDKFVYLEENQVDTVQILTYHFTSPATLDIIKMLQEKNYQIRVEALKN